MTNGVVVIGGGLAGLAAAVSAHESGASVTLWSKVHPLSSHSTAATGGINAAVDSGDSWSKHAEDTLLAGAGLADVDAVETVCEGAADEVRRLDRLGVPFNRGPDGRLGAKTMSGTSHARTLFAGDHTGRAMLQALWQRARAVGVRIEEPVYLCRVVADGASCTGAVGLRLDTGDVVTAAGPVVLATGGLGHLYATTTNAAINTGDGLFAAFEAGVPLRDMEMTQFYPTAFVPSGVCVTEELRTGGATLIDDRGNRVMSSYDPVAMEMTTRDVLSRSIATEIAAGRPVYLDARHLPPELLGGQLAKFVQFTYESTGVDITRSPLPVAPAFHYQMGGIATDVDGRTTLPGVLAAGECACVSVHGANRVGANSLLETLVMGRRAGRSAAEDRDCGSTDSLAAAADAVADAIAARRVRAGRGTELARLRRTLRGLVQSAAGVERHGYQLTVARAQLDQLDAEIAGAPIGDASAYWNGGLRRALELEGMVTLARAIIASALDRAESRGAHFRQDHPIMDAVAEHTEIRRHGRDFEITRTPVRGVA